MIAVAKGNSVKATAEIVAARAPVRCPVCGKILLQPGPKTMARFLDLYCGRCRRVTLKQVKILPTEP